MSRRKQWLLSLGGLAVVGLTVAGFFWPEIRVAYHRNRLFAASDRFGVLSQQTRRPGYLESLTYSALGLSAMTESDAMQRHQEALLQLNHFDRREFQLTNRPIQSYSNAWVAIRQQITNTFDSSHWWSAAFVETNKFTVTATPADMPSWKKIIEDFDRSAH